MSSVVIHPQYYPPGVFYDLALLQLDASADITKNNIGLECLPDSRGESYVVDQCVVTGWGKETFGASGISAILKKIQVRSLINSSFISPSLSLLLGSSSRPPRVSVSASEPETRIQVILSIRKPISDSELDRFRLHESFLCAGGQVGKVECTGDGRGPLMFPLGSDPNRFLMLL